MALCVCQQTKLEGAPERKESGSEKEGPQGVRCQCVHQRDVSIEGKGMRIIFERCIIEYIR
jgi:hypothetical protein